MAQYDLIYNANQTENARKRIIQKLNEIAHQAIPENTPLPQIKDMIRTCIMRPRFSTVKKLYPTGEEGSGLTPKGSILQRQFRWTKWKNANGSTGNTTMPQYTDLDDWRIEPYYHLSQDEQGFYDSIFFGIPTNPNGNNYDAYAQSSVNGTSGWTQFWTDHFNTSQYGGPTEGDLGGKNAGGHMMLVDLPVGRPYIRWRGSGANDDAFDFTCLVRTKPLLENDFVVHFTESTKTPSFKEPDNSLFQNVGEVRDLREPLIRTINEKLSRIIRTIDTNTGLDDIADMIVSNIKDINKPGVKLAKFETEFRYDPLFKIDVKFQQYDKNQMGRFVRFYDGPTSPYSNTNNFVGTNRPKVRTNGDRTTGRRIVIDDDDLGFYNSLFSYTGANTAATGPRAWGATLVNENDELLVGQVNGDGQANPWDTTNMNDINNSWYEFRYAAFGKKNLTKNLYWSSSPGYEGSGDGWTKQNLPGLEDGETITPYDSIDNVLNFVMIYYTVD